MCLALLKNFLPNFGTSLIHEINHSIIGGIVGSAIGAELGSNITQKNGIELLIETNGGRMISIIQEVGKYDFRVDQKVRIIKRNGKSRVVPFD